MNRELARLLATAGYERALEADAWRSVIVVNNFGSVPKLPDLPPEFALRGFKLLLLDASGTPTHFARCGTAADLALLREGEILEALSRAPELARSVPHTRSVSSSQLRVLVSTYLSGKTYDQFVHRETQQTWMRRALELSASAVILVHNHPSGDPTPSAADIDMTRQVVDAGRSLRIAVHDHLIAARDGVASLKALGLF